MEFDHNFARNELLLPKRAVYASPFDLKYYAEMKEVGYLSSVGFKLIFLENER
jgi:hypothetical protein